jgi:nicotinate-nucleotide adenylyltransferase
MEFKTERTHFLKDAPKCPYSSTEVRDRLERGDDVAKMIDKEVLQYIKQQGLWTLSRKITTLTAALSQEESAELYIERGKCYYRQNNWGNAINDFRKAEELKPELEEARQFREMVEEILEFRYKDIYNP